MENPQKNGENQWTILKTLRWTTSYFKSRDIESPRPAAEILLAHVLDLGRIDLYTRYDQPLNNSELSAYKSLIRRRIAKEPVAYITGRKEFWSMDFLVTGDTLIPRPETECLVETALDALAPNSENGPARVLELGTGSGAVVITLASERPALKYFACDRSSKAIRIAMKNASSHGVGDRIGFFCCDWFSAVRPGPGFDLIVSNPPYVRKNDINGLQPEINRYEPLLALDGGDDGLRATEHIIRSAHEWLVPGGILVLEIGFDQKADVEQIIENCGCYDDPIFKKDYGGIYRNVRMAKK